MFAIIDTKSIRRFDMVERKEYLKKLIAWKDEQVIKVVTVYGVAANLPC